MFYQADNLSLDVAVTGDSLITRRLAPYTEPDFLGLRDLIKKADIAFTNLEVVLGEVPDYPAEHCGGNWLGVPAYLADELAWMGFNLFSTANNHAADFGAGGVLATMKEMALRQLVHAGIGETLSEARRPAYLETPAARVALVAACSTLPPGHAAGEQRQDVQGRPGVNPLRFDVSFGLSPATFALLDRIAEESQIKAMRADRIKHGYDKQDSENEYRLLEHRFVATDEPGISTKPRQKDMQDILRWVKDAKRQADFCFVSLHAHEPNIEITRPAQFIETFSRACIDCGADGVFGHGPHVLRGIEIYKAKPIIYSLGNFIMQSSTMQRLPVAMYERYDVDPFSGTPADIFDNRLQKELIRQNRIYYESCVVRLRYKQGELHTAVLHPIHLGLTSARPSQGRPLLARGEMADRILSDVVSLSEIYGTKFEVESGLARVVLD